MVATVLFDVCATIAFAIAVYDIYCKYKDWKEYKKYLEGK